MTFIYVLAALIAIFTTAFILLPMWRNQAAVAGQQQMAEYERVRDRLLAQLAELDTQAADGIMDDAVVADERLRLESELAQVLRTLEQGIDRVGEHAEHSTNRSRYLLAGVLVLLLTGVGGASYYLKAGKTLAILGGHDPDSPLARMSPEQRTQIMMRIGQLEARLKASPDNPTGWEMLARSYRVLGRTQEAHVAFGRAQALYERALEREPKNINLLIAYAAMLYQMDPENTVGPVRKAYERLRAVAPDHLGVLWFFGYAAYKEGDLEKTVRLWERLRSKLPPEHRQEINGYLEQVKAEIMAKRRGMAR